MLQQTVIGLRYKLVLRLISSVFHAPPVAAALRLHRRSAARKLSTRHFNTLREDDSMNGSFYLVVS